MSKSVIVLGGAGFLGRAVIRQLLSNSISVASFDVIDCEVKGAVNFKGDVLNLYQIEKACDNYDAIINSTGQITSPIGKCYQLNTTGIRNIIKVAEDTKKVLLQISTVGIYGTADLVDEDTKAKPETPYSLCKAFAEDLLLQSKLIKDNLIILRLSNLFGEEQLKGIFAYLLRSYKSNRCLEFNNSGDLSRYYLHVNDCAKIIYKLLSCEDTNGVYNVIGVEKYTIKEIISLIEDITNIKYSTHFENITPLENINIISSKHLNKSIKIDSNEMISVARFINNTFR